VIIVMSPGHREENLQAVIRRIEQMGYSTHVSRGVERTIVGAVGHKDKTPLQALEQMEGVESVIPILRPYKLASREFRPRNTVIDVGGVKIGGPEIVIMAGPCSIESEQQVMAAARAVKAAGAKFLRGGAYKPRTSPYAFQGLEEEGLKMMKAARDETGLKIVTEIISVQDLDVMLKYVDVLQIGARNCQNYALLRAVGQAQIPVLLKRGMSVMIHEYLMAAEYCLNEGNYDIMLCERGIRTFETETRFTLDLNAVPVLKNLTHLPVLVDPSHGTGHWRLVTPMARAAVACGADGLIIEVHPDPPNALSDGAQSLKPTKFVRLMNEIRRMAEAVDRSVAKGEE
jgi:3-deoxy-7-phosphoheptulonate synthase